MTISDIEKKFDEEFAIYTSGKFRGKQVKTFLRTEITALLESVKDGGVNDYRIEQAKQ